MAQPRPFLFDTSFDPLDEALPPIEPPVDDLPPSPPEPSPVFTAEQLAAARAEGLAEGLARGKSEGQAAGRAQAQAAIEAKLQQAVTGIGIQLTGLVGQQQALDDRLVEHAVQVAVAIAQKLLPTLERRHGLAEIEALLAATLRDMREEPRIVVRVADELLDPLKARIDALAAAQGFAGSLVLLGDAELGPSDCRIEWADGGAERLVHTAWQEIDRAVARLLDYPNPLLTTA